jgi:hypothetical protein
VPDRLPFAKTRGPAITSPIRRATPNAKGSQMSKSAATTSALDAEVAQKVLGKIAEVDLSSLKRLLLWRISATSAMGASSATVQ